MQVVDRATGKQTEADDGTPTTAVQLSANGRVLAMDSADGSYARAPTSTPPVSASQPSARTGGGC